MKYPRIKFIGSYGPNVSRRERMKDWGGFILTVVLLAIVGGFLLHDFVLLMSETF